MSVLIHVYFDHSDLFLEVDLASIFGGISLWVVLVFFFFLGGGRSMGVTRKRCVNRPMWMAKQLVLSRQKP